MVIIMLTSETKRLLRYVVAAGRRCYQVLLRASKHGVGFVIRLLLAYGVSLQLCATGYHCIRTRLLRLRGEVEVNVHPETCAQRSDLRLIECRYCDTDTPLMTSVRWHSITMIQLLMDARTVLHAAPYYLVPHLLRLGADPHATGGGTHNALGDALSSFVISRIFMECPLTNRDDERASLAALWKIRVLLPVTGNLDVTLSGELRFIQGGPMDKECVALFLQHGARIKLRRTKFYKRSVQHSERFIELLRAADSRGETTIVGSPWVPTHPPTHLPTHPPTYPPTHPPTHLPTHLGMM